MSEASQSNLPATMRPAGEPTTLMAQTEKSQLSLDRVRLVVITLSVSERPSIGVVARKLGMTSRTLQRRLAESGTSFREMVASARQEVAERLLLETDVPVQEIAFTLGYATPGAFARAFGLRAKQSPRAWRRIARKYPN